MFVDNLQGMEQITIFGKTYEVSKQAKVAMVAYITALAAFVATVLVSSKPLIVQSFTGAVLVLMAVVGTYVINCLVVGQCHLYAWFSTAVSIIVAAMYVLTFVATVFLRLRRSRK